jgi:hypothetical protein
VRFGTVRMGVGLGVAFRSSDAAAGEPAASKGGGRVV